MTTIEVKVPSVGESVVEVQVAEWLKQEGDAVERDEPLATLETDKANVDLPAPVAGTLKKVLKAPGEKVKVGDVLALVEEGAPKGRPAAKPAARERREEELPSGAPAPAQAQAKTQVEKPGYGGAGRVAAAAPGGAKRAGPAARRAERAKRNGLPSGVGNGPEAETKPARETRAPREAREEAPAPRAARAEERVPMSLLRRRIAERLVAAQQNAALLTTFNEIDMTAVQALRARHGEAFREKHEVKLGFMSFFVKAVVDGLREIPQINAEVSGNDVVFRNYYDIGIAVGGGRGLVVPVLRDAQRMSFAEIESRIGELARRARENKLLPDELAGGTFTISNGGIYGSLLSTPIVNPPQSGVLGLHVIQDRPVARAGEIVIRPMMYVALTYDHRVVDGREAVTFLRRVKETIEDPERILLEV